MKQAQHPGRITLQNVLWRLREGNYVIPDFQREFEWEPWDISKLMRSIFLDYYIGSLLLWKGKSEHFESLSCEDIYGYLGTRPDRQFIVLDGQQRLSAMYYAFFAPNDPLPRRQNAAFYFIFVDKLKDEQYDEAFQYKWRWGAAADILASPEKQYARHIFPLSVFGDDPQAFFGWIDGYKRYWSDRAADGMSSAQDYVNYADAFRTHVWSIVGQYQVSYIELDADLELDKICDIFTQINTRGRRLDVFDLINALLVPKGIQLKNLFREERGRFDDFLDPNTIAKTNVYVLQIMSILAQAYCSPKYLYYLLPKQEKVVKDPDGRRRKEVLVPDTDDFRRRWDEALDALEHAIRLLRQPRGFGVASLRFLPYVSILPVFSALQRFVRNASPELQLSGQQKIRHWYWAAVFTSRYSGSVESTAARDFLDVNAWIQDDSAIPSLVRKFENRLGYLSLKREVRRGTSVYNGIFCLFVMRGPLDWVTGVIPRYDEVDDHHIVPKSWGKGRLPEGLINTVLNRTPLSNYTNRKVIGNKLPNVYLPKMIEQQGREAVESLFETHCISPRAIDILLRDPFTPDDFEDFINERERTILGAIKSLLKERPRPGPDIRELDRAIESVELELRRVILDTLGDVESVPEHVLGNVNQRIRTAIRKNPALDVEYYQALEGKLEYFDLRELEDTVVSKLAWKRFEPRFGSKGTLATRFTQLADLRNCIRHSRTVDEVTELGGRAAIIWFQKVLGR